MSPPSPPAPAGPAGLPTPTATVPAREPGRDREITREVGGTPSIKALLAVELLLTAGELALIAAPLWAFSIALGAALDGSRGVFTLAAVLWLASVVRIYEALGRVRVVVQARQQKATVPVVVADRALAVLARLPVENGLLRAISWALVVGVALLLEQRITPRSPLVLAGLCALTLLHAVGLGALRALIMGELLGRWRGLIFPTAEGMRLFAMGYRGWLALLGLAIAGLAHLLFLLLGMSLPDVSPEARAATVLFLWPVLLPGAALWFRSLAGRVRPIEAYFDVTMRSPGTRGPARDEPRAVAAFRAAQSLPYRLAGYEGFVLLLAGVVAVAASRRLLPMTLPAAVGLLVALVLVVALAMIYFIVLGRRTLAPLVRQLGSRHALPIGEIRSRISLGAKLLSVFGVVAATGAGVVALVVRAPAPRAGWAIAAALMGVGALVALVLLVTRALVTPIHALEARSEEMARGELARPLPPSGEADEIGRLGVAFEEMRRALRDRLRSTESINIDLEREVRRRTEALEQRNVELREALEKLRRAQDNLVRSEKLASMGRLVAGIAHEINNPVNAVINSIGPLEETVKQLSQPESAEEARALGGSAEEMLAVIKRGAGRTKAIVQALHNYSRGDESIEREVSLERSVEDSLDLLRHRLRDVSIVKELEPGVRILGLPGQIDQVLMNLVTNAAQAIGSGEGGKGGTIRIGARPRVDGVEVWVTDDGPGIPPDVLARIFDPFFTTKEVGEGSGLGLSIVHGIVERHGGRIDVQSAVGEGTTFRMLFPHVPERRASTGTAGLSMPPGKPE
jgi:signal transduction histidine kinase